ncbi:DUF2637 domain-containing protein [Kitasatospora sp. NPDC056138]|uniref:DUF2637 domain-containing protein n=1 Tax=Kitasatospora sp. NPDC056138 TaxID=3345724 RepID=UPI0035DFFD14
MSRAAKGWLVTALLVVVAMAFGVSWNALHDIAAATGARGWPAVLYPFVVDGLMALALAASLILTGKDRTFALSVLGAYTAASLVLNYVHGLVPALHTDPGHTRLAGWALVHWLLVGIAAGLPVGSIFFGSDLVARVLHHRPDAPAHGAHGSAGQQQSDAEPVPAQAPVTEAAEAPGWRPAEAADDSVYAPQADPAATAGQPATAPPAMHVPDNSPEIAADVAEPPAPVRTKPRTAPAPRRARPLPGAAKNARPVRTDDELLAHLRQLLADADGPLSQRAVLAALGIGVPRLRTLLDANGLTLTPEPVRPDLRLLDAIDQAEQSEPTGEPQEVAS